MLLIFAAYQDCMDQHWHHVHQYRPAGQDMHPKCFWKRKNVGDHVCLMIKDIFPHSCTMQCSHLCECFYCELVSKAAVWLAWYWADTCNSTTKSLLDSLRSVPTLSRIQFFCHTETSGTKWMRLSNFHQLNENLSNTDVLVRVFLG